MKWVNSSPFTMRVNNDSHSLFSSFKSPSPTLFSSPSKYDSLPSSNSSPSNTSSHLLSGDSLTKTYINKFENFTNLSSPYSTSPDRPERPPRTYSPAKFDNSPSYNPASPRLATKFPRYFGANPGQPDYLTSSSEDHSPGSSNFLSSSSLPNQSADSTRSSTYSSKFTSLPPLTRTNADNEGRSSSPLFGSYSSLSSKNQDLGSSSGYLKSLGSPKLGRATTASGSSAYSSPTTSLDSTNPSSFLKLARLNLTPVKFRATKLKSLG